MILRAKLHQAIGKKKDDAAKSYGMEWNGLWRINSVGAEEGNHFWHRIGRPCTLFEFFQPFLRGSPKLAAWTLIDTVVVRIWRWHVLNRISIQNADGVCIRMSHPQL